MTDTATRHWYPTHEQITASGDQFLGWSTQDLIGIADRVTPDHALGNWVATVGTWQWDAAEQMWNRRERNEATGTMDVTMSMGDDSLREYVIEQLENYRITRADVGYMKS